MHTIGEYHNRSRFLFSPVFTFYELWLVLWIFSSCFSGFSALFQSRIRGSLNIYTWHILNAE